MPENRTYLPRRKLLGRYGVTEMTLWRWERDPLLGFPQPVVINSKKFFDVDELAALGTQPPRATGSDRC